MRDTPSVPFLLELASAGKFDYPAIRALGEIGDPRAKEPLARLFREAVPGSEEQQTLAVALGKLGDPAMIAILKEQLKSGRHGDTFEPPGAIYDLTGPAADALAHIGAPAVPVLLDALDWQYTHVAPYAAQALGRIGDRRALEPLAGLLDRRDYHARHNAAEALGDLGDPAATPHLVRAVGDERGWVRVAAAEALLRLGDRSHLPVIIEVLRHCEDDWDRAQAAAALGRIGGPEAIAALKEARRDSAFEVRWAATKALVGAAPG
jgi:HEAT repeat protein